MRKKRIWALLLALVIAAVGALAWLRPPVQAASATEFYRYELEAVPAVGNGVKPTSFELYVRPENGGGPLHTGTVALGVNKATLDLQAPGEKLSFSAAEGFTTASLDGTTALETGETTTGFSYVAFTWYLSTGKTAALDSNGRQYLGRLTVPYGWQGSTLAAQNVALIPWPETETGQEQLGRKDLTAEDLALLIADVWRVPGGSEAGVMGFYQGFRASTVEDEAQERVDIRCAWQGLRLVSWDPKDPVIVEAYQKDVFGKYPDKPEYRLKLVGTSGTGLSARMLALGQRYKQLDESGEESPGSVELRNGTYKVVLRKQSHVSVTFLDVTVKDGAVFPELTGVSVTLPCGDVNEDGHIRQLDRALLTAPKVYGKGAESGQPYDLDGDGKVTQYDLAILTAPANYGKDDLEIGMSEGKSE